MTITGPQEPREYIFEPIVPQPNLVTAIVDIDQNLRIQVFQTTTDLQLISSQLRGLNIEDDQAHTFWSSQPNYRLP